MGQAATVPVIDLGMSTWAPGSAGGAHAAGSGGDDRALAGQIDLACRDHGFFAVANHGVDQQLIDDLEFAGRRFLALPDERKEAIAMRHGGRAWRGWFPLGGELTSGRPDGKEGIYFGSELPSGDPRPMHGPNQFPDEPAELRALVLRYLDELARLGRRLVELIDLGLGADGALIALVDEPTLLFRIFGYPPGVDGWGVGEHTDYGLLTLLHCDQTGGLEVRNLDGDGWTEIPPRRGTFICNIGDMLETATGGVYRSTPHRVVNRSADYRVSMPLFFDPSWGARVERLIDGSGRSVPRWDDADPHLFEGTYGDYVWHKVGKVFPDLA